MCQVCARQTSPPTPMVMGHGLLCTTQVELVYGAVMAVIKPEQSLASLYGTTPQAQSEREEMSNTLRNITRMYFQSQEEVSINPHTPTPPPPLKLLSLHVTARVRNLCLS